MKSNAGGAGAPTKYDPERHVPLIRGLARDGMTMAEIAEHLGIHHNTLTRWRNRYPEVGVALKHGKAEADAKVEESLYRRACGITVKEVRKTINKTKDAMGHVTGQTERIEEFTKELPPDTTAMIYWLKNRQPDKWRDKQKPDDGDTAVLAAAKELVSSVESAIG